MLMVGDDRLGGGCLGRVKACDLVPEKGIFTGSKDLCYNRAVVYIIAQVHFHFKNLIFVNGVRVV